MRPRILFVDDHEDTRVLLLQLLDFYGYDVTTAASLAEGARLAESESFDLFLFDQLFTDGTGKELCEKIRKFDGTTPILFFSGWPPAAQRESLSCGAQGFVLKPDFDALRREIGRELSKAP